MGLASVGTDTNKPGHNVSNPHISSNAESDYDRNISQVIMRASLEEAVTALTVERLFAELNDFILTKMEHLREELGLIGADEDSKDLSD